MPHLIDIAHLSRDDVWSLLDKAEYYLSAILAKNEITRCHAGVAAANLFFESSTRTSNSFQLAEQRHGMLVLNPNLSYSAMNKGESLEDTLCNLEAMGVRLFVVRHPDDLVCQHLSEQLNFGACLMSAGSGMYHHPTQALLDVLTIRQYKGEFSNLSVAVIGDLKHSRVVRSFISVLLLLGATDIRLISPPEWSLSLSADPFYHTSSMKEGVNQADVIMCLRIQKERFDEHESFLPHHYHQQYGLNDNWLTYAKPNAIVMHPGPVNRAVEITDSVADGPQSVILKQVENGVAVRMAAIDFALGYT